MSLRRMSSLFCLAAAGVSACDGAAPPSAPLSEGGDLVVVEAGKEDNFISSSAREFTITGSTTVTLEASYANQSRAERLARAKALVPFRQVVVGWFLSEYLVEKESKETNARYGGFQSLTKNGSYEDLNLREVDALTFAFDFRQEVAGPPDLIEQLPTTRLADGRAAFDLRLGRVSTEEMQALEINGEWYRKAPWDAFNPRTLPESQQETLRLVIERQPPSTDAYFDYRGLLADGVLDIGVHFGWDYHSAYHLKHSAALYEELVSRGFESPVARFADLKRTSGPLTRALQTPDGEVEVRVSLFWGQPGTETDPDTDAGGRALEADMRASLAARDVIVFSGHSGPFYGFALANWKKTEEGDLDDAELPGLELPAGRAQLVFAEGCDTYAIGEGFFANPAKQGGAFLDVITTTSFSNAETPEPVYALLDALTNDEAGGVLRAWKVSELLRRLDGTSPWFSSMYGLHGIDDNPRGHPFAADGALCAACSRDSDCGGPGNRCVTMGGAKACTFECTADDGCGIGFVCQPAARARTVQSKVCATPRATCDADDAARAPLLVLDSAVPAPDADLSGDGVFDDRGDESVTVKNAGGRAMSLAGYAIADRGGVRFTFPSNAGLEPGEQVTVFGGGGAVEGAFVAPNGLSLNNRDDAARLLDPRGRKVDELTWRTSEAGAPVRR